MYFSLMPKKKRENLYNREREFEELEKSFESGRQILLTGIRRIGKTSLLQAFLNELSERKIPNIFIDCRSFEKAGSFDKNGFNSRFKALLDKILSKNLQILKKISKISLYGIEFKLNSDVNRFDLFAYLDMVNELMDRKGTKLVIALDEAQFLRFYGRGGKEILNLLAHVYDHLENMIFILTGSEIGVLYDFIGSENPESPLYGRYINQITLERFPKEKSIDFLVKGFEQVGIKPKSEYIEKAVESLDGIVGYLSMYGYIVQTTNEWQKSLEEAEKMAFKIVKKELNSLKNRSENYMHVLKAIAFGAETFSQIKKYIEIHYGNISDQTLSNNLNALVNSSFLEVEYVQAKKLYRIPDPVIKKVLIS